nr:winged helix-turn-helix domain-containing protein [Luteimonas sp. Y-2-2-4F]
MEGGRRSVRVTPKALAVLRVLAAYPHQVVSRQALLAAVWPETLPTEDVLNQAITQLRKAFGSGPGGPEEGRAYIETIAKSGYRLMRDVEPIPAEETGPAVPVVPPGASAAAPVQHVPADASPEASDAVPAAAAAPERRARSWRVAWLALSALIALAAGAGLWWWGEGADEASALLGEGSEHGYRLITSSLGLRSSPTLSPDGQQVAYVSEGADRLHGAIMIQPTRSAPPRRLTPALAGTSESEPRWSRDGRDIAFLRRSGDGACSVMIAPADGSGAAREVLRCEGADTLSFDWTADGRGLVFGTRDGPAPAPGLRVLDLATGDWRAIEYDHEPGVIDHAPRYSPDGRWILFARNPQLGDLWRVPATGGKAERLTDLQGDLRGWAWISDDEVVFGRRVDAQVRLFSVDLPGGSVRDLGLDDAQAPTTSLASGALAFVRRRPQFGLFRVEIGENGEPRKERIFASSGRDNLPVVSPDGRRLLFASDRAGPYELWLADLLEPEATPIPVAGLNPEGNHPPIWSADGRSFVAAGLDPEGGGDTALFEVDAARATATALPVPERRPLQGAMLGDGRLLVGAEGDAGAMRLVLYERGPGGDWQARRTIRDVSQFRYEPEQRRVLFTRLSADGLWEADAGLDPDSIRLRDRERPTRRAYRSWSPSAGGGVDHVVVTASCLSALHRTGPRPREVCLAPDRQSATTGFSVDRRSGVLYLAMVVDESSDIGFAELPRRPKEDLMARVKSLIHKNISFS